MNVRTAGSPSDSDTTPGPTSGGPSGGDAHRFRGMVALVATGLALLLAAGLVLPRWWSDDDGPMPAPTNSPTAEAEGWIATNVTTDQRLVVDATVGEQLLDRGFTPGEVIVAAEALDVVPGIDSAAPDAWRQYDYVVVTRALQDVAAEMPVVRLAITNSVAVAVFGDEADPVEIRRVVPQGVAAIERAQVAQRDAQLRAGIALAGNSSLDGSPDALDAMRNGQVDERLLNVLATLGVQHDLQIAEFPAIPGEEGVGAPRRVVEIDSIDFQPVTEDLPAMRSIESFLESQLASYRPTDVRVDVRSTDAASLRITYAFVDPAAADR